MRIYTSESVSEGHPDKLADQISDALLDAFLEQDPRSRVAIETLLTRGVAVVAGEVTTEGYVDVARVVRQTVNDAGYTDTDLGFDGNTCGVLVAIQGQSADIAMGVDVGGAGDQGMMFGYASNETPELMPLPISIAHALTRQASEIRRKHPNLGLRPDVKSQVSVEYSADGKPKRIDTVVVSAQHAPFLTQDGIKEIVRTRIIQPVLAAYEQYQQGEITYHINPTGQFIIGGPQGDTGVTGRKIIVDTYGGMAPHGGGAFSGKDPTKVDRSAAYMARHVAKNIVAAGLADRVVVQFAYAIGVAQPVAVNIETFGTETVDPAIIEKRVRDRFDLSPAGIIKHLGLLNTKYLPTAKNGHFGNPSFPWESTADSKEIA
ncbi:methionine adenosyltransferase [Fimbriimonas ginsengisoli]|uniref:S-adenosylmethionine synthase n=1 Tax=Fimbriimonas ginsengisoli Gsoil 348 TaxID=661478 RepID=A0A068NM94_FIMGI|nr:methionine adenosyltransferase [Fimbriimonas ginsengisoli]AIE84556.1 methionine adenosyltransferase [Fimbriimonas ginsengisoli Gsoil 348]